LIIIQQGEETILQNKNSTSQKRMQVLEVTVREGGRVRERDSTGGRQGGGERYSEQFQTFLGSCRKLQYH